ncbi:MAG: acyloxyacyl hydrolase [Selenomonadaceae bacterium]|nr:acyloxyacyl hydrolase [Selenomonadaceae bacterium]
MGPRVTYHFTSSDSVSTAYIVHHASNGFKTHNPGYNGVGLSLGYRHAF